MRKQILAVISSVVMLLSLTACEQLSDTSSLFDGLDSQLDTSNFTTKNDSTANTDLTEYESLPEQNLNSQTAVTSQVPAVTTKPSVTTKAPATTKPPATVTKPPVTTKLPATTKPSGSASSAFITEVVRLVNVERAKGGLSSVSVSSDLNAAAAIRANEIITKFDHTRPDGTSCFTVLKELNISYNAAGENIASGQTSPEQVMTGWMNSPGHKANIMNSSFNKIGVGYVTGGSYGHNWVQLFTN